MGTFFLSLFGAGTRSVVRSFLLSPAGLAVMAAIGLSIFAAVMKWQGRRDGDIAARGLRVELAEVRRLAASDAARVASLSKERATDAAKIAALIKEVERHAHIPTPAPTGRADASDRCRIRIKRVR